MRQRSKKERNCYFSFSQQKDRYCNLLPVETLAAKINHIFKSAAEYEHLCFDK